MDSNSKEIPEQRNYPSNKDQQAVDKAPGEERGKEEQVTNSDLKGKKVDADLDHRSDQPINQLP
ncbi:MAG TPA: hypothetical protein VM101_08315 [Flavitalea sp.]|nr:hypothetical protein [Flavitalea sp.]